MDLEHSVEAFFHGEVDRAFRAEGLSPGVMVEHYVVQLLARYAASSIESTPLALRMAAAVDAPPRERRKQLRAIGDTSLYVSGFWRDSLEDAAVDVDYYVEMGGSAYGELARGGRGFTGDPYAEVFAELAGNFVRFGAVLALVSQRTTLATTNQDVFRLYRRWQRSGSPTAAARLAALGVIPGDRDGRTH